MLYQRDVYGKTLVELGKTNDNIVVLDADLSSSTRTGLFAKEFPDRFFNFGVAEQNMVASAAGLAASGESSLDDVSCINKSFPGFIKILKSL